ncbi:glycosyltransferase family 9 protein [Shewanella insulae]|uniref:glycosyltransferase family 9 protein n=1 Tax=Shewanella insulae TaxID=2681496 RepID=UPI00247FDEE6|nr:glycosyltransferase family 9 protein [Shewanella insulae]
MIKRILVIRNDKIGDFVNTWPALYELKMALPNASIEVFVAPVLEEFAKVCPFVDHVIVDNGDDPAIRQAFASRHYDAVIVSRSQIRTYRLVRQLDIPYKLAPKLNWYQYLYRHRASIEVPKGLGGWRKSCMLVEHFLNDHGIPVPPLPTQYWDISHERRKWQDHYGQQGEERLIFAHPGTGGSANSISPRDFANLLIQVDRQTDIACKFVLTYSGQEISLAQQMYDLLIAQGINVVMANPLSNLADFARSLVAADMFMAGSTGPLHIAGLHNIPTVGFYAGRRSAPKVRWQTLTQSDKRLAFTPPIGKKTGRNMALIDFDLASKEIASFLNTQYARQQAVG